jgi:hypothetical protein
MPLPVGAMVTDEWLQDLDEIRMVEMGERVVKKSRMMAMTVIVVLLLLVWERRHCRRLELELRNVWRIVERSRFGWMDSKVWLPRVLPLC